MGSTSSTPAKEKETNEADEDATSARSDENGEKEIPLTGIHALANAVDYRKYQYPFENLALEGGGNKGIAYCGALRVLEELGISVASGKLKRLAGTSSGAMTAALIAVGYDSNDLERFFALDVEDIFLDSRFGYLSLVPNILSIYGWNPGNKILSWFGEKLKERMGDADISFLQLYKKRQVELCVVVVNLNQMSAQYCHHKTTPDMPIRVAVRMSMSIPVMFAPVQFESFGNTDLYVDGGVVCNFPIHSYDGWWLSTAEEDSFFRRFKTAKDVTHLMQQKVRFGKYNEKTLGFMLFADNEEDLFRSRFQNRAGTKLRLNEIPDTELGKKYKEKAKDERSLIGDYDRLVNAVDALFSALEKHDANKNQRISLGEFTKLLDDPTSLTKGQASLLFGEISSIDETFADVAGEDDMIDFNDILFYLEKKGLHIQCKLLGYRRTDIGSLSDYIGSINSTILTNVGRLFMHEHDVQRAVGINTGHVGTRDFNLKEEDRLFLINRGRKSAEAFLKYYVVWNKLKPFNV